MAYGIGILLALAAAALGTTVGFDRGRTYYPVMTIVVASYYVLFATLGGASSSLLPEVGVAAAFAVAAIAGYRTSMWLVVAALALHGAMDLVHDRMIDNAGVPPSWPAFCMAFDVTAAACLALILKRRGEPAAP